MPTDCRRDCQPLSAEHIKRCGFTAACLKLGFLNGECRNLGKPCPSVFPTTCDDCKRLGPNCIENNGADEACKKLGWDPLKRQCKPDLPMCPTIFPTSCEACEKLGNKCIVANGATKQCEKLGWDAKKEQCKKPDLCISIFPNTCDACEKLGNKCIQAELQNTFMIFQELEKFSSCSNFDQS